jgi:hypothetical protein
MALPIRDESLKFYYQHRGEVLKRAKETGQLHVVTFTEELRRLCKVLGYNFPAMWAQAANETGHPITGEPFASDLWKTHRNPAGLKTSSAGGYQKYHNGVDAARAFVVHMSAYATPPRNAPLLAPHRHLDARYLVAMNANRGKTYATFDDLEGRWAEDRQYGNKIEEKYDKWFGG